jgi:hypothetical protein
MPGEEAESHRSASFLLPNTNNSAFASSSNSYEISNLPILQDTEFLQLWLDRFRMSLIHALAAKGKFWS